MKEIYIYVAAALTIVVSGAMSWTVTEPESFLALVGFAVLWGFSAVTLIAFEIWIIALLFGNNKRKKRL